MSVTARGTGAFLPDAQGGVGEKLYLHPAGQLESLTLAIQGESEVLTTGFGYDRFNRIDTITYPSPNGAAPFVVGHDYDAQLVTKWTLYTVTDPGGALTRTTRSGSGFALFPTGFQGRSARRDLDHLHAALRRDDGVAAHRFDRPIAG
jgi:hypothetical protein